MPTAVNDIERETDGCHLGGFPASGANHSVETTCGEETHMVIVENSATVVIKFTECDADSGIPMSEVGETGEQGRVK